MFFSRLNILEKERSQNEVRDSSSSQPNSSSSTQRRTQSQHEASNNNNNSSSLNDSENNNVVGMDTAEDSWGSEFVASRSSCSPEEERAAKYLETQGYSSFLYWRQPLDELVDVDLGEREEELEVVREQLGGLDTESDTDTTATEKTESKDVPMEEVEKKDLPEKNVDKDELDNFRSLAVTETEDKVDNSEKMDDNENENISSEDVQLDKQSDEKGETNLMHFVPCTYV